MGSFCSRLQQWDNWTFQDRCTVTKHSRHNRTQWHRHRQFEDWKREFFKLRLNVKPTKMDDSFGEATLNYPQEEMQSGIKDKRLDFLKDVESHFFHYLCRKSSLHLHPSLCFPPPPSLNIKHKWLWNTGNFRLQQGSAKSREKSLQCQSFLTNVVIHWLLHKLHSEASRFLYFVSLSVCDLSKPHSWKSIWGIVIKFESMQRRTMY